MFGFSRVPFGASARRPAASLLAAQALVSCLLISLIASDAIAERLPGERLPEGLLNRIEHAAGVRRERAHPSWQALAAAVILAAVMASGATWFMLRPGPAQASAELVVASHVRALMAPQPIDVNSSDRHTVKPWFNGRIPQSPQVEW